MGKKLKINLQKAINKSKFILDLKEDWDENGGVVYDKKTYNRAVKLVKDYAKFSKNIKIPSILPGPADTIDIHWKTKTKELLLNIPPYPHSEVERQLNILINPSILMPKFIPAISFYGDDYPKQQGIGNSIKGEMTDDKMIIRFLDWFLYEQD